jgi:hypothetical protein
MFKRIAVAYNESPEARRALLSNMAERGGLVLCQQVTIDNERFNPYRLVAQRPKSRWASDYRRPRPTPIYSPKGEKVSR